MKIDPSVDVEKYDGAILGAGMLLTLVPDQY